MTQKQFYIHNQDKTQEYFKTFPNTYEVRQWITNTLNLSDKWIIEESKPLPF